MTGFVVYINKGLVKAGVEIIGMSFFNHVSYLTVQMQCTKLSNSRAVLFLKLGNISKHLTIYIISA